MSRLSRYMTAVGPLLVAGLALMSAGCHSAANANLPSNASLGNGPAPTYRYQVANIWPHDSNAFTQGLVFSDGKLFESTGQEGQSSLRLVELETGKVLKKVDVPSPYFAEGIALLNGKIYQLTWQHQLGFIYDASTFGALGQFTYYGEGWGLTTDGHSLIMSDGTNRIRFLDPDSFRVTNTIAVMDAQTPIDELNELEYIHGEIYANVWHKQRIATIDPQTGRVKAWIDLTGIIPPNELSDEEAVLNGIAYDEANGRLFVTGKLWPHLFEIRVRQ